MRTVTFYSYKGGVGRSLALANAARYLAILGQRVFAVDFDLEAPGLHYKFKIDSAKCSGGTLDLLSLFITGDEPPATLEKYVIRLSPALEEGGDILLMPAGSLPRATYWQRLAQVNWHELFYSEDRLGIPFFLELKERIRAEYEPDFLLIDARMGVTELGGVATSVLADDVVCFMAHNLENLEGARAVLRSICAAERPGAEKSVRLLPVIARIPPDLESEEESKIVEEVKGFLNKPAEELAQSLEIEKVFVLHSEPGLQVVESLTVAQSKETDSLLLQDYLRLFGHLVPDEVVTARIKP